MGTRYVALGPLLSGEGSRAFLGLKITDGEASPCALIWVPERVLSDPELVEQLRRDTSRAAGLDHPNVVRVHGLIEVEEGQARVVEFADGESLRRVLDVSKRLPSNLAARVAADAALGVQYAHLAGNEDGTPLVHGDLRPETLLVSYSGVTKVSGYGALNVAPKEMGGKRVMGRRLHCAPEQILGGRDAVTAQTDVYLLGVILYELLTGVVPFEGEKDFDKAVLNKQPPLLNSEYVPPILRPIIGKAMAKKGPLRYPTAQAFREAIEEAMGELADHAELAAFLDRSFCSDDARAARRRELENGIQEWVVRKGLKLAAPPKPPPPVARKVAVVPLPVAAAIEEAPVAATPAADVGQPAAPPVDVPVGNPAAVPEAASQAPVPALAPASAAEQAPVAAPTATPAPLQAPPSPTAPSVAPNAPPAIARAPAPERVATPRPRREDEHGAASRPAKTTSPWLIALPLAAAAAGLAFWYGRHGQPQPQKIDYPKPSPVVMVAGPDAALEESALAPLVPPAPAPTPTPAAVVLAKADPAPEPALAVIAAKSVDARPTPAPLVPAKATPAVLDITVEPAVNVSIDGKSAGRTPLKVEVAPGNHRLTFFDPGAGIHFQRSIKAKPGQNPLSITLGKGKITVSCPPGAEVRVDNRPVGITPLAGPVTVFEGAHRIQVSRGGAKWQDSFTLADGEQMNFEVEISGDP